MESLDVELRAQRFLGLLPEGEELERASVIGRQLGGPRRRPGLSAIGLAEAEAPGRQDVSDRPFLRPAQDVNPGIDDHSVGGPHAAVDLGDVRRKEPHFLG